MRLTLHEAPTHETRPDHNTGNSVPSKPNVGSYCVKHIIILFGYFIKLIVLRLFLVYTLCGGSLVRDTNACTTVWLAELVRALDCRAGG